VPAFGVKMNRERGLIELAGNAAIEVGIVGGRDRGFGLGPQRCTVRDFGKLRPGFPTIAIGTGTWPDCACTSRSIVARSV